MKRWFLLVAVVIVLVAAAIGWYLRRPFEVLLPVTNNSDQVMQILFYGEGLEEHVMIPDLQPEGGIVVTLVLKGTGPIRVKAESERASVDAQLIDSNRRLRRAPLRFEIQPGNQFVLVPL